MDANKLMAYESRKASTTKVWMQFLIFGWSYGSLNKIGLQILFYITFGCFGIWTMVRFFTLSGSIKKYNRRVAAQVGLSLQEMATLNLL